jgi:F-type H+-transporting ATPase subunit alpha
MIIIFAGTQGFVDDLPVREIRAFERQLHQFMETTKSPLVQRLILEKALNEETRAQLLAAMKEFKEKYCAERGGEAERAGAN